jgi:hypothetical protein
VTGRGRERSPRTREGAVNGSGPCDSVSASDGAPPTSDEADVVALAAALPGVSAMLRVCACGACGVRRRRRRQRAWAAPNGREIRAGRAVSGAGLASALGPRARPARPMPRQCAPPGVPPRCLRCSRRVRGCWSGATRLRGVAVSPRDSADASPRLASPRVRACFTCLQRGAPMSHAETSACDSPLVISEHAHDAAPAAPPGSSPPRNAHSPVSELEEGRASRRVADHSGSVGAGTAAEATRARPLRLGEAASVVGAVGETGSGLVWVWLGAPSAEARR